MALHVLTLRKKVRYRLYIESTATPEEVQRWAERLQENGGDPAQYGDLIEYEASSLELEK